MPRPPRIEFEGAYYHVSSRGNGRREVFRDEGDRQRFLESLGEACGQFGLSALGYCLMGNHFHLLLGTPRGNLSRAMQWLQTSYAAWFNRRHRRCGHPFQGRYKSFSIQQDEHFLTACRYVERNALRANLVRRAQDSRWCSLWRRERGSPQERAIQGEWPLAVPADWVERVNRPQSKAEEEALRLSVARGRPFGEEAWQRRAAQRLGLQSSLRPNSRPRKRPPKPAKPGKPGMGTKDLART